MGTVETTTSLEGRDVITPAEAARYLHADVGTVTTATWKGDLPAIWTGLALLIDRRRLLAMLDAGGEHGPVRR
jgi:hypothetical protein